MASAEKDRQNNQAMVEIKDNLKKAIFTHTFEGFVDFATAFDTLDHQILLKEMEI